MATRKQKEDLIKALKFTPRDITINLWGYGGEIVLGRITEEQYDFWRDRDDLSDFVHDWDNEMDVPADVRFITDGAWHDVDDLCHESGCEASDCCSISVYDELEGQDLWESNLDIDNLEDKGVEVSSHSRICPEEDQPDGTCVFLGQNFEKGTFFSGSVRITQPFDPKKLSISWTDCDGWRLIGGIEYDGEEVEGHDGYSTTGKSMEFRVYQVENAHMPENACTSEKWDPAKELDKILQDIPVLEGEEMWAQEAIDSVVSYTDEQKTPWHDGKVKPVHKGQYEIMLGAGDWPFPMRADWTGRAWQQDGEKIKVKQWRGLKEPV